jgi:hypothetical protein
VDCKKTTQERSSELRSLTNKEKKVLAKQVTDEVTNDYDFKQEIEAPIEELIGIGNQAVNEDLIPLDEMNTLIDYCYKNSFIVVRKLKTYRVNFSLEVPSISPLSNP